MRRKLSQLLILMLMLLSPLTFSTDKVPNFAPEGETCATFRPRAVQCAATVRPIPVTPIPDTAAPMTRNSVPDSRSPQFGCNAIPLRGRAPPAFPSFSG